MLIMKILVIMASNYYYDIGNKEMHRVRNIISIIKSKSLVRHGNNNNNMDVSHCNHINDYYRQILRTNSMIVDRRNIIIIGCN